MTRSTVVTFVCGLVTGWLVVVIAAGVWILYAKSKVEHLMDQREEATLREERSVKLTLLPPPLEADDYGLFDYNWTPGLIDGTPVDFGEKRDRILLINVWATWCRPCVAEMPELKALADWARQENHPIEVFLVSMEREEIVKEFLQGTPLSMPVIAAHDELPASLWTRVLPTTYIVRPGGQICSRFTGGAAWSAPEVQKFLLDLLETEP